MRRKSKFYSINVVPFVDIMLVLLVIVLLSSSFIKRDSIKTKLPTSSSQNSNGKKDIDITIKVDDRVYLNKNEIVIDEISSKLATFKKSSRVFIYASKDLKYSKFVDILDLLQINGFSNISIVTQK